VALPHLLLVDDSEAVLSYERAALSGAYLISAAENGRVALEKARELRPAAVLLDLSMPEMDGEEVLAALSTDPALKLVPVIVISSERQRAEICLTRGAAAYLPKPFKGEELRALVARVLEVARLRERQEGLAALPLEVGGLSFGVPLAGVRGVVLMPETSPIPGGAPYLCEMFELDGAPVLVLDLARRFGLSHATPLEERKLVILSKNGLALALEVDRVHDPEEIEAEDILRPEALGGGDFAPLSEVLIAIARRAGGLLPVVEPGALVSPKLLARLPAAVKAAREAGR
jgi:CheY-like chemotaxis protein